MNIIQELIETIKTKNSWGKDELLFLINELLAKHFWWINND